MQLQAIMWIQRIIMWIASLIARPLVALLSLTMGILSVSALDYWESLNVPNLEPVVNETFALAVSACDLGQPSAELVGKRISVNATVYHVAWRLDEHSEDFIVVHPLIPPGCSYPDSDPFITTELDLRKYSGPNQNLKFELGPFEREVDVRILGTVRKVERPGSLVKYKIEPEEIELISPWREFTPKGAA